jgi:hypothetical protein
MENRTLLATVPVTLEFPAEMKGSIQEVLAGEYESGYSGKNLTALDIGANIGSFAIWAAWRWPNSRIQCYEPHPGRFRMLMKNVAAFPNITPVNAAVWPGEKQRELFQTRYDGDGESGLWPVSMRPSRLRRRIMFLKLRRCIRARFRRVI